MKKIITCLLSICFCFIVMTGTVVAEDTESYLIGRKTVTSNNITFNVAFFSNGIELSSFYSTSVSADARRFTLEFNDSDFHANAGQYLTDGSYTQSPESYVYVTNDRIKQTYKMSYGYSGDRYNYSCSVYLALKTNRIVNDRDYIKINGEIISLADIVFSDLDTYYIEDDMVCQTPNYFGDINFDKTIDIEDAQLIMQYYTDNLVSKNVGTMIDYLKQRNIMTEQGFIYSDTAYHDSDLIQTNNEIALAIYKAAEKAIEDLITEGVVLVHGEAFGPLAIGCGIDVGGNNAITVAPASNADAETKFKYLVFRYCPYVTNLSNAQVQLNSNYEVQGVGVQDKNNYCGSYPKQMTVIAHDKLPLRTAASALSYGIS